MPLQAAGATDHLVGNIAGGLNRVTLHPLSPSCHRTPGFGPRQGWWPQPHGAAAHASMGSVRRNAQRHPALTTYVVAGVTGSGKSTVGQLLAARLGSQFFDGDDFHSEANKAKMRSGEPLTDVDRMPWLALLAEAIQKHASSNKPTVFACSALKCKYREVLAAKAASGSPAHVLFSFDMHEAFKQGVSLGLCTQVVLMPPRDVLQARLEARWKTGQHFMPPSQLDAQLADLELDAPTPQPSQGPSAQVPAAVRGSGPQARLSEWMNIVLAVEAASDAAPLFVLRDVAPPEALVDKILARSAALSETGEGRTVNL